MAATEPHLRDNPTSVSQGSTVCTISCRHQESLLSVKTLDSKARRRASTECARWHRPDGAPCRSAPDRISKSSDGHSAVRSW